MVVRLPALTPALLASVGDLEVVARTIVDGLRAGPHRSPFHGYSAEFSQYRHYRPGDDLKYVDWKLLARTDRLYTRQYRETTDLAGEIVIDASASMGFAGARGPSKLTVAAIAAAALAYLLSRQGDAIGLQIDPGEGPAIPPRAGSRHLQLVLAALSRLHAAGRSDLAASLRRASDRLTRRGLFLCFSDLYDDEAGVSSELRRARQMGHDVAVFQVVTPDEMAFPFRGDIELRDLESGEIRGVHAAAVRAEYRDRFAAFLDGWRARLHADAIDYSLLVTEAPLDEALRGFLLRRRRAA